MPCVRCIVVTRAVASQYNDTPTVPSIQSVALKYWYGVRTRSEDCYPALQIDNVSTENVLLTSEYCASNPLFPTSHAR